MDARMQIKIISNMPDDDPRVVESRVNDLSADGWLLDALLTTATRLVMQKWVKNNPDK